MMVEFVFYYKGLPEKLQQAYAKIDYYDSKIITPLTIQNAFKNSHFIWFRNEWIIRSKEIEKEIINQTITII